LHPLLSPPLVWQVVLLLALVEHAAGVPAQVARAQVQPLLVQVVDDVLAVHVVLGVPVQLRPSHKQPGWYPQAVEFRWVEHAAGAAPLHDAAVDVHPVCPAQYVALLAKLLQT
jgi:hypothetical protein